jgi:hypothetical protein
MFDAMLQTEYLKRILRALGASEEPEQLAQAGVSVQSDPNAPVGNVLGGGRLHWQSMQSYGQTRDWRVSAQFEDRDLYARSVSSVFGPAYDIDLRCGTSLPTRERRPVPAVGVCLHACGVNIQAQLQKLQAVSATFGIRVSVSPGAPRQWRTSFDLQFQIDPDPGAFIRIPDFATGTLGSGFGQIVEYGFLDATGTFITAALANLGQNTGIPSLATHMRIPVNGGGPLYGTFTGFS